MAGCCTGSEIDLKEMRTPGQKDVGNILGPLIAAGIGQGATPFGGQLSQGPDQAQMAAMNTMMGIGGKGQYQQQPYPQYAWQGYGGGPIGASGTSVGTYNMPGPGLVMPGPSPSTTAQDASPAIYPSIVGPNAVVNAMIKPGSGPQDTSPAIYPSIVGPNSIGSNPIVLPAVGPTTGLKYWPKAQGGQQYDPYQSR